MGLFGRRRPVAGAAPEAEIQRAAEWRALPALAPSLPPMPLTFGTDAFEAQLPTRDATRFVAPLAHAVSAEAPPGVIGGLIEPVVPPRPAVRNDGPPLTVATRPAPRGRSAAAPVIARRARIDAADAGAGGPTAGEADGSTALDNAVIDGAAALDADVIAGEQEVVPLVSAAPPLVQAPTPPELPARVLPVVAAASRPPQSVQLPAVAASHAEPLPTTSLAAPVPKPLPAIVQRTTSDVRRENPHRPTTTDAPVLAERTAGVAIDAVVPSGEAPDVGRGVPDATSPSERPGAAVARPPALAAASPVRGAPAASSPHEDPPVQRRLGLGAPLPAATAPPTRPAPLHMPVAAPPTAPATPRGFGGGLPVAAQAAAAAPAAAPQPAAEVATDQGSSRAPVGLTAPVPAADGRVVVTSSAMDGDLVVQRAASSSAPFGAAPLTVPTLGTRPRAEARTVLNPAATEAPMTAVHEARVNLPPVAQRSSTASPTPPSSAAVPTTAAGQEPSHDVPMAQRAFAATGTVRPLVGGTALPPIVNWAPMEQLALSPPPSGAPLPAAVPGSIAHPEALTAPRVATALVSGAPSVQRAAAPPPTMSVPAGPIGGAAARVPPAAHPVPPTPAQVAVAEGLGEVAADGSIEFHMPDDPVVQLAAFEAASAPAVQTAAAPAPNPGPGHHDESEKLQQLAKQLYDSIRDQLKAELRLDRERWGRVTDIAR